MPHFQRPFLKFVYEKPSTHKRVSAKTDEADAQRLDGTDTAVAAWRDAIVCVPGNVDALLAHQDDVLYGNTLASLDMVVDKEFEAAFQMCQYSAQYLHQCVEFLSQRCATYVSSRDELLQRQDNSTHILDAKVRFE
ncbi:hypothetical protein DYB37_004791 [Aphanomyces astaci]|uniref:Uncharacterized protein n=1 Tax=Aphanomyces astaci TaxID=112090 RepID=A0A418FPG9_APHAT|nr:hypothetical protein DYB37_004791 [Aphanomyces astaci]